MRTYLGMTAVLLACVALSWAQNVGIGTAAPQNRLHVDGPTPADANSGQLRISEATNGRHMLIGRAAGYGFIQSHNSHPLALNPLGNNVGIGTTNPTERLHVEGNLRLQGAFMPGNNAGTAGSLLRSAGAGAPPVWIAPGANGSVLTVSGGVPAWSSPNGLFWGLTGNSGTNPANNFIGTVDAVDLVIRTSNTERVRVTSNGLVGIGTSTPGSMLHVLRNIGNAWNTIGIIDGGANAPNLRLAIQSDNTHNQVPAYLTIAGTGGLMWWKEYATNWSGGFTWSMGSAAGEKVLASLTPTGGAGAGATMSGVFSLYRVTDAQVAGTGVTPVFGTEAVRLNASGASWLNGGNVGIGNNNPQTRLDVWGNIRLYNNNTDGPRLIWTGGPSASREYRARVSDAGNLAFFPVESGYPGYVGEVLVLTQDGRVGIGESNPVAKFHVSGTRPGAGLGNGTPNDAPSEAIIPAGANGTSRQNDWPSGWAGGISTWDICGMSIYMSNYTTRSDASLKTSIQPLSVSSDFVERFMRLRPVTYRFREDLPANEWDKKRLHYGFIANEVESLFPDIVVNAGTDPSIPRGLEYDAFIAMLVEMVQRQERRIQALEERVAQLEKALQS